MIPTKTQAFCFLTLASCSIDVEGLADLLRCFPPHPVCHGRAAQVDQFINAHVVRCMQHTIQEIKICRAVVTQLHNSESKHVYFEFDKLCWSQNSFILGRKFFLGRKSKVK
jgi:hypothetical protein